MISALSFCIVGLLSLCGIAFVFSNNRKAINWRLVSAGITVQLGLALLVLKTTWGSAGLEAIASFFVKILNFAKEGSSFMLGPLVDIEATGFVLAAQILPPLIFLSSLTAILYHLGILQKIVGVIARSMSKVLPISGAESLSVAANIFVGQTEAPLVVKPYVKSMTESELFLLMVGGMASVAGNVLAAYIGVLAGDDPAQQLFYAKHLLAASFMSAPAAIVIAKIMIPESQKPLTMGNFKMSQETVASNVIEAAAIGASDGMKLAINVAAMLFAFVALIALINAPIEAIAEAVGWMQNNGEPANLSTIIGWLLSPLMWLIGIPWADAQIIGSLMGEKVVFNEFIAYINLRAVSEQIGAKSQLIATYALCGFANFGSIAVQIGGISAIAPSRRTDLARLGVRSIIAGSLATLMTGTIAGLFI